MGWLRDDGGAFDWLRRVGQARGTASGVDRAIETATGESDCSHEPADARESCSLVGTEKNGSSPLTPADISFGSLRGLYRPVTW